MFDINLIREQPELVKKALQDRQMDPAPVDEVFKLDADRRSLLTKVEALKAERNTVSKEISQIKDAEQKKAKIEAMRLVGEQIAKLDDEVRQVEEKLNYLVSSIPNLPDPTTPYGKDDSENVVLRTIGDLPKYDFKPLPHWDLGTKLGIIDFGGGVKLTGSS